MRSHHSNHTQTRVPYDTYVHIIPRCHVETTFFNEDANACREEKQKASVIGSFVTHHSMELMIIIHSRDQPHDFEKFTISANNN